MKSSTLWLNNLSDVKFSVFTDEFTDNEIEKKREACNNIQINHLEKHIQDKKGENFFHKIIIKYRLFVYLIIVLFIMLLCWLPFYFIITKNESSTYAEPENKTHFVDSDIIDTFIESDLNKIYICANYLNYFSINYFKYKEEFGIEEGHENNIRLLTTRFDVLRSLKRAHKFGITDILLPESNIDVNNSRALRILENLVEASALYNITIGLLLDQQLSLSTHDKSTLANRVNTKRNSLESHIKQKFQKFIKCGIKTYFFQENPLLLTCQGKDKDINFIDNEIYDGIDYKSLTKITDIILQLEKNINLFYLYENDVDHKKLKDLKLKFYGGLFKVNWDSLIRHEFNTEILTKMFTKDERENKVLMLDFILFDFDICFMKTIIGLYLFSPIPIILNIGDYNWHSFFQGIFVDRTKELTGGLNTVNDAVLYALNIKKHNSIFKEKSKLIGVVECSNEVISAIRAIHDNMNVSQMLFLLYSVSKEDISVDVWKIFTTVTFEAYSIVYDSTDIGRIFNGHKNKRITMKYQQLMIISPQEKRLKEDD